MAKKNTFGFIAFTAAASLGLALTAAGCGTHNGSTTLATLGGNNNVIFQYSLAASASGRTVISRDITKVSYSFTDSRGNVVKTTGSYDLKHSDVNTNRDISVPSVPSTAKAATAAYYDSFGSIVAVGINDISWNYDNAEAVVSNPQVAGFEIPTQVTLQANRYVLSPEETTTLSLPVQTNDDSGKVINLISFADVTGMDEYTDVLSKSDKGQTYTGVSFTGTHKGTVPAKAVKAVVPVASGNLTAFLQQPIYVTAQTLESIKVSPAQIDGQEVTVYGADTEEPYSKVLMSTSDAKNANLGQKVLALHNAPKNGKQPVTEVVAVGAQSFVATAIYSDTNGRGPVPENIDVTNDTDFTIEQSGKVVSVVDNTVNVNSAPDKAYIAKVTASYNDNGKLDTPLTDAHTLRVYPADAFVFFSDPDSIDWPVSSLEPADIPTEGYEVEVFGNLFYNPDDIEGTTTLCANNFVLPKTIVSEYPEAKANGTTQSGAVSASKVIDNKYRITIDKELTANWTVTLEKEAYSKLDLPKFTGLTIENTQP